MKAIKSLTVFERALWAFSVFAIIASSLITGNAEVLTVCASLVGVTALIFVAKGNALGQVLTVVFSILYAVISFDCRYYGEMVTYLGMTAPIAALSVISWLKNPYDAKKSEVKVARLTPRQKLFIAVSAIITTAVFYFILRYFNTANLIISTVSITTSFLASALMYFRNKWYALAYASNDVVLITLWVLASLENAMYFSMAVCFLMFLCNDLYGYYNWHKMQARQA